MRKLLIWMGFLAALANSAPARDLYVNNVQGQDSRDGLSPASALATVEKALQLATAGDTVHLTPTDQDYREKILLKDKGGEPGQPITLDGHGIFLDGSEPAASWEPAGEHLWTLKGEISRGALVVDRRLVLERKFAPDLEPGQFCVENTQFDNGVLFFKPPVGRELAAYRISVIMADGTTLETDPVKWRVGSMTSYKLGEKLRPVRVLLDGTQAPLLDTKDRLLPGKWCLAAGQVYYYPPAGRTPPEMEIRRVERGTGITLTGKMAHVVVRNFNVRYVWNDAYNIHGEVTDAAFYNCNAYDCFDEGFSAHDACETLLDGAIFERCDNGVFNVNKSGGSVTRNLTVRQSRDYGYGCAILDSTARHSLTQAVLEDNPTPLFGRYLEAEKVSIINREAGEITLAGPLRLEQATVRGPVSLTFAPGNGPVEIGHSAFLDAGAIAFEKAAQVTLNAVYWSPGAQVLLKKKAKPLPIADWLNQLSAAGSATGGGLLPAAPAGALLPGIGWPE